MGRQHRTEALQSLSIHAEVESPSREMERASSCRVGCQQLHIVNEPKDPAAEGGVQVSRFPLNNRCGGVCIDRFSQAGQGCFGIGDRPHGARAMRRSRAGAEMSSLDAQVRRDGSDEMEQGQHSGSVIAEKNVMGGQ